MQQIKILYVEDYDLVLFTVKQLLESENWQVEICRDGNSAQKRIEQAEQFDLIILDAQLPGISGLEIIKQARALPHRRQTPIIMFTASDCQQEALDAGTNIYLKKPGGIRNLLDDCKRLLHLGQVNGEINNFRRSAYEGQT